MKKILLILFLHISAFGFGQINSDSLWNVIHSPEYSDSLKLEAYEVITKDLIHSEPEKCREICEKGLEFARSVNNSLFEWSFFNRIGITYLYEENYEKTFEYWRKAINVAEYNKDTFALSQNINNMAYVYEAIEQYDKAINFFQQAIKFKDKQLTKLNKELISASSQKEKEEVEEQIRNTLFGIGMQRNAVALAFGKQHEWDSTLHYLNQAVPILDQLKDKNHRFDLLTNIGSTYSLLGAYMGIQKHLFDALKYLLLAERDVENVDVIDRATWYFNVGEVYFKLNDPENGYKYISETLRLAKKYDLLQKQENCYSTFRDYYLNKKDYKNAYYYHDSVQWIEDSLNLIAQKADIAELETKYETEKKERENLELKQEVREQELENLKEKRMRNIFISSTIVFLIFIFVISYLFSKLRHKNILVTKSKEELEKLNHNLRLSKEETEKALEFKSLFLANMSHEIRTPLNIILGFNSILKKQISDVKLSKYLESIEMSSYNLLRFLNDILDMSKIEAGKILLTPDSINLKLLIMNIRELFMLKANEKNIELHVEIDSKVPSEIIIDEIRLRQILVNLIGNAIKFTNQGYVKIAVDAPVLNKYQSEFSTKTNIRIQVIDSGIGISQEDMTKIFESFRQVNIKEQKQMGGTGLGLAITKRLSEMMNGEITVESKLGEGSTFTVIFKDVPIGFSTAGKTSKQIDIQEELEYEFTGGKILVADDEEMNRSLIKVCFENTSVTVLEATNGNETIDMARKHKPDIVMMDIKMPGLDGLEASRIIKKESGLKDIKIIAFSASNIFDRLEKDEIGLFYGLISKPVLLDEMFELVSKILPNRIKEKKPSALKNEVADINDYYDEDLEHILTSHGSELETLKQKWQKVYSTNSMNKILEFANEIKELSVKYNLPKLQNYAAKINEAGQNFDILMVKQLLKYFPEILNLVKA
jgi:polar amino acid transport system substrate-binding protein/two-component system sensor histidine kinase EvgS